MVVPCFGHLVVVPSILVRSWGACKSKEAVITARSQILQGPHLMCAYSFSTSSTNLLQTHFKIFELTEQIKKQAFICFTSWVLGNTSVEQVFILASPLCWLPVKCCFSSWLHSRLFTYTLFLTALIHSHGFSF